MYIIRLTILLIFLYLLYNAMLIKFAGSVMYLCMITKWSMCCITNDVRS